MSKKNDHGKKDLTFIRKLTMQFTPEAIMTLYDLMQDENQKGSVRRACATDLLAYGWGKPKGTEEVAKEGDGEHLLSPELQQVLLDTVRTLVDQSSIMRAQGNSKAHEIIEGDFSEITDLLSPPSKKLDHDDGDGED